MKTILDINSNTKEGKMVIAMMTELLGVKPYCQMDLDQLVKHFWGKTLSIYPEITLDNWNGTRQDLQNK